MPVKKYKPTSPGRRGMSGSDFAEITRSKPEKSLTEPLKRHAGRNNQGRITVRHRGGGHKRRYRIIDFKRDKDGIPAKVVSIEYDPNRTARIALVVYNDGEKRYILAPNGLAVGQIIMSGPEAEIRVGNTLPLRGMPLGSTLHNIELQPGRGGQLVRSAGAVAQLMAKEGKYAQLRMPSGEVRLVPLTARATLGQVGKHRAREREHRQSGTYALDGHSSDRSRIRHEPCRPPARRWRRQGPGRRPAADSMGTPGDGLSYTT